MEQPSLFDSGMVFNNNEGDSFRYKGEQLKNGEICPYCFRKIKVNATKLSKPHVIALVNMYRKGQGQYHHYDDVQIRGNNSMSKMRYFGLISKKQNEDPTTNSSGMYRLTHKGIEFIHGNISVPEKVYTYNDTILGFTEAHVAIESIAGQFDIKETITNRSELVSL